MCLLDKINIAICFESRPGIDGEEGQRAAMEKENETYQLKRRRLTHICRLEPLHTRWNYSYTV